MKKLLTLILAAVLLVILPTGATALDAEATRQTVGVDGTPVDFSMYTVYDTNGFATNYVKLRDVAWALRDTRGHFGVTYDGSTRVDTGWGYDPDGTEMAGLATGSTAQPCKAVITVNGKGHPLDAYLITPPGTNAGNFYFKLRDLGQAIGFGVYWSAERGVYIETW